MKVDISEPLLQGLQGEVRRLRAALDSATVIGQATGILMERRQCDTGRAFSVLVQMCQQEDSDLRQVADEIVSSANRDYGTEGVRR